jgi:hypothetical protein
MMIASISRIDSHSFAPIFSRIDTLISQPIDY